MPSRTQITRHDCVEGWSAIGKWTGVPLSEVLARVGPSDSARYVVFHCADLMSSGDLYYESIDMEDAYHPQTILAYGLNDAVLPIANGAPLRLRLERQLGYKMAKYVMRIELVASFAHLGRGRAGTGRTGVTSGLRESEGQAPRSADDRIFWRRRHLR